MFALYVYLWCVCRHLYNYLDLFHGIYYRSIFMSARYHSSNPFIHPSYRTKTRSNIYSQTINVIFANLKNAIKLPMRYHNYFGYKSPNFCTEHFILLSSSLTKFRLSRNELKLKTFYLYRMATYYHHMPIACHFMNNIIPLFNKLWTYTTLRYFKTIQSNGNQTRLKALTNVYCKCDSSCW